MHINITGLQKTYDKKTVLDINNLHINKGELIGVAGNNGAGKTTLLRLMLDLIKADRGQIEIAGEKVHEGTQWKKHTGSYIDEGFLIDFLTAEEYFHFSGEVYGLTRQQVEENLQSYKRFMNDEILNTGKHIRQLSTGNKQKVGIIAAMMVQPDLLLLDEPFNFLDPTSQIIMRNMLREMNQNRQTTMLISSHNINHLAEICSRVILLEKGIIIEDIQSGINNFDVVEEYFARQINS